jgi:hypothetical protein
VGDVGVPGVGVEWGWGERGILSTLAEGRTGRQIHGQSSTVKPVQSSFCEMIGTPPTSTIT